MHILERLVVLQVMDRLWIEHLEAMDQLREGIGLRAIGQRDPLVEYKNEGFRLFQRLTSLMESEIATTILRAQITHEHHDHEPVETAITQAAAYANVLADTSEAGAPSSDGDSSAAGNRAARRAAKKKKRR